MFDADDGLERRGGADSSDLDRDEIQCLFNSHDTLLEMLYQTAIPAVQEIFICMLRTCQGVTDTREALIHAFVDSLSRTSEWNRLTVADVTRSWGKIGKQTVLLVQKLAKVKALVMAKNGLVSGSEVHVRTDPSTVLHAIVVYGSTALIEDMEELLASGGRQATTEIILRRHQAVERAVVHLVRDALNELLMGDGRRESRVRARDRLAASETLRFSRPVPMLTSGAADGPALDFSVAREDEEDDVDEDDLRDLQFPPDDAFDPGAAVASAVDRERESRREEETAEAEAEVSQSVPVFEVGSPPRAAPAPVVAPSLPSRIITIAEDGEAVPHEQRRERERPRSPIRSRAVRYPDGLADPPPYRPTVSTAAYTSQRRRVGADPISSDMARMFLHDM